MRVNVKRWMVVGAVVVGTYFFLSYSSIMEIPGTNIKSNAKNLMNRLNNLQKQMNDQLTESNKLLQQVKNLQTRKQYKEIKIHVKDDELEAIKDYGIDLPISDSLVLPVLLIACDRVTVKRCLDNLVKFRPSKDTFPIIVSQDCGHNATYQVIRSFTDTDPSITVVQQPDLSEIPLPRVKVKFRGYYKIARHYKFALNHVFKTLGHQAVIIVEDDLDISQDFFEYFLGTYPLLLKDPSLWCISAWNDNGKKEVIDLSRPELLHRTDFFPGLGWTMRKDTWLKLEPKWPEAFFDDWLRDPANTDGKACIRPEISRTFTFGKAMRFWKFWNSLPLHIQRALVERVSSAHPISDKILIGVSKGLFYDMHLRAMQLNMMYVEFTKLDLSYLLKENYDNTLESTVYSLPELTAEEVISAPGGEDTPVRVTYSNAKTYQKAAKKLGLMDDFRSGVPRTAYRGIVSCFVRGRRVYLAPSFTWTRYDPHWG